MKEATNMRDFGTNLIHFCQGKYNDNKETAKQQFKNISDQNIMDAFEALNGNLREKVTKLREFSATEQMINNAFELFDYLCKNRLSFVNTDFAHRIEFDLLLFKVTLYSHQGINHTVINDCLNRCQKILSENLDTPSDIDRKSMYNNRKALFEEYSYNFDAADKTCADWASTLEALKGLINSNAKSRELGKLYGTKAQIKINQYHVGTATYEDVKNTIQNALDQFDSEDDKKRQYQYIAGVEADSGDIDSALEDFARGFGFEDYKQIFKNPAVDTPSFAVYHLSRIALGAVKIDKKSKLAQQVYNYFKDAIPKYLNIPNNRAINKNDVFDIVPQGVTCINLLLLKLYFGKTDELNRILEIIEYMENLGITFTLPLYAEVLCALHAAGCNKEYEEWAQKLMQKFDSFEKGNFRDVTKAFFAAEKENLNINDPQSVAHFAKTRLY